MLKMVLRVQGPKESVFQRNPVGVVGGRAYRSSAIPIAEKLSLDTALASLPAGHRAQAIDGVRSAVVSDAGRRAETFGQMIRDAAQRVGLDESLVKAVVEAESAFNPQAVSRAGAKGLMQLMDGTARSLGVRDPFDPASNLAGGAQYLRSMLDRFGSVPLALAAYNAGPGAVEKYGGIPPYQETKTYVDRVLQIVRREQAENASGLVQGGSDGRPPVS